MRVALIACTALGLAVHASAQTAAQGQQVDLRKLGAFGFPQTDAIVLYDKPELRLSWFNDSKYLYVQAVVWGDSTDTIGTADDGRPLGDWASLPLDIDANGWQTGKVDRSYSLNPWPALPGLRYTVAMDAIGTTSLLSDSTGRGSICYLEDSEGKTVRVDNFLIPLEEAGIKVGPELRFAYYGSSADPAQLVNSIGYGARKLYYAHDLPREDYHRIRLVQRNSMIDPKAVPEGRDKKQKFAAANAKTEKAPEIDAIPEEVQAAKWLNWRGESAPTLKSLRGRVVVVEFWATWCGPCVAGIPHLNELHEKYANDGLTILSLTDQPADVVEKFAQKRPIHYTVGSGSNTGDTYGVKAIPRAFLIGRDGKLRWTGHPGDQEFDKQLKRALSEK